jgi:hypothetical protein
MRDSAHWLRCADLPGDFRVAPRRARRYLAQRLPNPLLENGAPYVQRQVDVLRRRLDKANDFRHKLFKAWVIANQRGLGKLILKFAHQGVRIVSKSDRTDTRFGSGDQDRSQGALANGEPNQFAATTRAEFGWCHAKDFRGFGIKAAARIEPGAVDRLGDGVAKREFVPHSLREASGRVGLRRDARDHLKDVMKVEAAHARGRGERREIWHLLGFFDHTARLRHRGGAPLREWRLVWPAPLARPEACPFCLVTGRMKGDILASRQPGLTTGAAIHTRREHRIIEYAVRAPVAVNDGGPAIFVVGK